MVAVVNNLNHHGVVARVRSAPSYQRLRITPAPLKNHPLIAITCWRRSGVPVVPLKVQHEIGFGRGVYLQQPRIPLVARRDKILKLKQNAPAGRLHRGRGQDGVDARVPRILQVENTPTVPHPARPIVEAGPVRRHFVIVGDFGRFEVATAGTVPRRTARRSFPISVEQNRHAAPLLETEPARSRKDKRDRLERQHVAVRTLLRRRRVAHRQRVRSCRKVARDRAGIGRRSRYLVEQRAAVIEPAQRRRDCRGHYVIDAHRALDGHAITNHLRHYGRSGDKQQQNDQALHDDPFSNAFDNRMTSYR